MRVSLGNGLFKKFFLTLCPLLLYPVQAESKGDNEPDEGDKAPDGDNEKTGENEQDSEGSEDAKSGTLRKLFIYPLLCETAKPVEKWGLFNCFRLIPRLSLFLNVAVKVQVGRCPCSC